MTFSWTQPLSPEMTETTPTSVATPMMMPSRVRKLRRRLARSACTASRGRSSASMAMGGSLGLRVLLFVVFLGLLDLDGIVGLQGPQRFERSRDEGFAALQPR